MDETKVSRTVIVSVAYVVVLVDDSLTPGSSF